MTYRVIVTKLPQEASKSLAQQYLEYTNERRRSLVYSADDCVHLLSNSLAQENSYAEIVHPNEASQAETIAMLDALNLHWEELVLDSGNKVLPIEPNYSQNDPRWKGTPLGDGSQPHVTIGSWGCLSTAYSTMAVYMGLCKDTPDLFNARMLHAGAYSGIYVQPAALRTTFPDEVSYHGWYTNDIVNRCKAQIDIGVPVPARVDLDPSSGYTQHWVLIVGYTSTGELIIADGYPYESTIKLQRDTIYDRIHEVLIYDYKDTTTPPVDPPTGNTIDLAPYFSTQGNSNLFELETKIGGVSQGQERVQLKQYANGVSHITKNALYEELKVTGTHIQRSVDTSMSHDDFYYLAGVGEFVNWMKRHMRIGEQFKSTPIVTVVSKSDCSILRSDATTDYLTMDAVLPTFECFNGVVIKDVLQVSWRKTSNQSTTPVEVYYFANGLGLVGWGEDSSGKVARVSELHNTGDRPDNIETYYCGWGQLSG